MCCRAASIVLSLNQYLHCRHRTAHLAPQQIREEKLEPGTPQAAGALCSHAITCQPVIEQRCGLRMSKLTQPTTVTVLLLSLAWATPAKAQWPDPNVYCKIKSTSGWGCLDIRHGAWVNNTGKVRTYSGQYWRFTPAGNGFFNLTNLASGRGMCLDVGG